MKQVHPTTPKPHLPKYYKQLFLGCLLGLLLLPTSQAQDTEEYLYVYPIRVDHKWGYVKIFPSYIDTVTAPRYDYMGDINLPYNNPMPTNKYRLFLMTFLLSRRNKILY